MSLRLLQPPAAINAGMRAAARDVTPARERVDGGGWRCAPSQPQMAHSLCCVPYPTRTPAGEEAREKNAAARFLMRSLPKVNSSCNFSHLPQFIRGASFARCSHTQTHHSEFIYQQRRAFEIDWPRLLIQAGMRQQTMQLKQSCFLIKAKVN